MWLQNLPEEIIMEPVLPSYTLTFGFSPQFPLLLSIPVYYVSITYDLKCLFIRCGYKISLELYFYSLRFFIPVCKTVVYPFFYMWFTAVFWKMLRLSLSELHACLNNWHAWMIDSNINLSMVFMGEQELAVCRSCFFRSRTDRERSEPQALWAHHALLFILMFLKRQSLTRPTGKFSIFLF